MESRVFVLVLTAGFFCWLQVARAQECKVDGRTYKAGQKFTDKECTAYCTCKGPFWGCVSLCPPMQRSCPPDHQKKYRQEPVQGTRCSCRRPYCVPKATCFFDGKRYRHGERFTSRCNKCMCNGGRVNCVPVCPMVNIRCPSGHSVVFEEKRQPGSDCKCKLPTCKKNEDSCTFEGKTYTSGERFIDDKCSQRCRCHLSRLLCVPLCPAYGIKCGYNSKVVYTKQRVSSKCFCQRPKCVLRTGPDNDFCSFEGKKYRSGEVFTNRACSMRCSCRGKRYSCVSLCPPMTIRCPPHTKLVNYKVKVSERCECPRMKCERKDPQEEFCSFEGKKYRSGESFTDKSCSMRCSCRGTRYSCVSLCPPMAVRCQSHEKLVNYRERVSEKCFCPRSKCEPRETDEEFCSFEGKKYRSGESFTDKACSMRCSCRGTRHSCVSLCPPMAVRCPSHKKLVNYRERVSEKCFCPRSKCEPRAVSNKCFFEGKTYQSGERFVDSKCTMSCRCRGSGYACVSLCPPVGVVCPPGQKISHYRVPATSGCTCERPRCVPKV